MFKRERSRWEIILEILRILQEETKTKKTRIMQKACLDWRNFERYFAFLLEQGYVVKSNPDARYELTDKGKELLGKLKEVKELL
jgi:predicted transcriptional regulator